MTETNNPSVSVLIFISSKGMEYNPRTREVYIRKIKSELGHVRQTASDISSSLFLPHGNLFLEVMEKYQICIDEGKARGKLGLGMLRTKVLRGF